MQDNNKIDVKKFIIHSNYGDKKTDISGGLSSLMYYENIFENSIKATVIFADTGNRNTGEGAATEESDVNLQGGEKVYLSIEDELGNKLKFSDSINELRVHRIRDIMEHTQSTFITLDLCTNEYIKNQLTEYVVTKKYNGFISDTVESILKNVLKTEKEFDIDKTINKLNFTGDLANDTVFSKLVWLATRSVPQLHNAKGKTAGFFFYETAEGFKFKSIDNLLNTPPKKKFIFNNTIGIPNGYDEKILAYNFPNTMDVLNRLKMGTDSNKRITFNPFTNEYKEEEITSDNQQDGSIYAGNNLPQLPEEFRKSSRRTVVNKDIGVNPDGNNIKQQLEKSKEMNFNVDEILNQSFMRFNQLFAIKLVITIFGDITLHVGDIINCNFPEISSKTTQMVSNKKSGKYLIVGLCHYISPNGPNYTKMQLVRDSYGKSINKA